MIIRFIPTPVGSIFCKIIPRPSATVHPHACGEYFGIITIFIYCLGSSPRLWGVYGDISCPPLFIRFIPTPVGSIKVQPIGPCFLPVHPHACGEYTLCRHVLRSGFGSSPRLWGVSDPFRVNKLGDRFIPTPVGSMASERTGNVSSPVHPHACGEYIIHPLEILDNIGSSPRLWGVSCKIFVRAHLQRFIPTPVGSIPFSRQSKR